MRAINEKEWSILIYANGNNEMEPEMYRAMKALEKGGSNSNVSVVLQIGRSDRELAKIMRPLERIPPNDDYWTGVRRYYVEENNMNLIEEMGKINMADPNNLYDFIKWGFTEYRAKHYMLILSGHGIAFVGGLTDLSYNKSYIMGLPEMAKAINMLKKNLGYEIDILVLDMCYMNYIESIYEFGNEKDNATKNILTYLGRGPFGGLPYNEIVSLVKEYYNIGDIKLFLTNITKKLDFNLIAYEVDNKRLTEIKDIINNIAIAYINDTEGRAVNLFDLIKSSNELNKQIVDMIIFYNKKYDLKENLANIVCEKLGKLIGIYCKLSFARNNMWTHLLSDGDLENYLKSPITLKPMIISREAARRLFTI